MNEKYFMEYDSTLTEQPYNPSKKIQLTEYPVVNEVWEKIISFALLSENWDSYDAVKPTQEAIIGAMLISQLLLQDEGTPAPSVVPAPNGNIQLEWSCCNIDLEIEVFSESSLSAYFEDYNEHVSWEEEFTYDLTKLTQAINLITNRNAPKLKLVS